MIETNFRGPCHVYDWQYFCYECVNNYIIPKYHRKALKHCVCVIIDSDSEMENAW